jgi:hypothetical protein
MRTLLPNEVKADVSGLWNYVMLVNIEGFSESYNPLHWAPGCAKEPAMFQGVLSTPTST